MLQFTALLFALDQKLDHGKVYQCHLAQVQDSALAAPTQCPADGSDVIRLDVTADPKPSDALAGLSLDLHH